jgi:hypothetical protein
MACNGIALPLPYLLCLPFTDIRNAICVIILLLLIATIGSRNMQQSKNLICVVVGNKTMLFFKYKEDKPFGERKEFMD